MDLTIYTDGGSLNNPGPAACSYLIFSGKNLVSKASIKLGIQSNNVAEYSGLINALTAVKEITKDSPLRSLLCISDSLLMVKQLTGEYKIKHPDMKKLAARVHLLEMELGIVPTYKHVLREKNADADTLVGEALGRK
ncbi:ribonuclease H [Candidatus Roizmanbacteria bacterium CG_4_10_14_0_8_um_filter_39_9]|uniref:Ribonuclease H n=1 Tax=Candidatus Roizmanbacteria bacterium CG_4_10_14_0_8_um_filter_39_9 TaxID=1974829 RepID=A0A2M7QBT2_9BACT|nr:MAG: ribonuclease H [Candidatus Roizmanbacteria bacterium CG_4_10_14_0_8_um_filter_39_9]